MRLNFRRPCGVFLFIDFRRLNALIRLTFYRDLNYFAYIHQARSALSLLKSRQSPIFS